MTAANTSRQLPWQAKFPLALWALSEGGNTTKLPAPSGQTTRNTINKPAAARTQGGSSPAMVALFLSELHAIDRRVGLSNATLEVSPIVHIVFGRGFGDCQRAV